MDTDAGQIGTPLHPDGLALWPAHLPVQHPIQMHPTAAVHPHGRGGEFTCGNQRVYVLDGFVLGLVGVGLHVQIGAQHARRNHGVFLARGEPLVAPGLRLPERRHGAETHAEIEVHRD